MQENHIEHGDCLEILAKVEDSTFDMAFADPPFNLQKKYASYKDKLNEKDYLDWCQSWIAEMVRVTKPGGAIFLHNIPKWLLSYSNILSDMDVEFRHWIAWDAPTIPMGKSLQPAHYGILYYTKNGGPNKVYELRSFHKRCRTCKILHKDYGGRKSQIHPVGPLLSDVWSDIHRCKHNKYKDDHPCQLPIHLLERIILLCTNENDFVLDCFMGSGTTAIAAKRLGRNYFGSELDKKYVDIANSKLEKEKIPSCINGMWISCFLNQIYTVRDLDTKHDDWKDMYENWLGGDTSQINHSPLHLKKEVKDIISLICE